MKILFYQNNIRKDVIWSANVHIMEVLNNLVKLGHTVIYINGESHSVILPSRAQPSSQQNQKTSLLGKIKHFVYNSPLNGEAIVLFYLIKEIYFFIAAFKTTLLCKPDVIYRRHSMFNSEYLLSRILRIPCVVEINGIIFDEYKIAKKGDVLTQKIINRFEKYNLKRADKYIAVTQKLIDVLFQEYKVPKNKVSVIENGANANLFQPRDIVMAKKELNLSTNDKYLCFVGSIAIWHGVKYLILALPLLLKENPNIKALIVGESSLKFELENIVNELHLSEKVIFTGRVAYEKVPWYISASDICVVPFILGRNQRIGLSSLKLCEYLACGKPVVASRVSGFEFIEQNDCGYLVKPESPQELAKAITKLLGDPVNKQRMGENGRKYVLENRSWEIQSKKVAEVCEKVIQESKKPKK
jgi:glycosyltransferase involved in cell wall biosynthesis